MAGTAARPDRRQDDDPRGGARPGENALRRLRGTTWVKVAARSGLAARGVFYILLAGLAVALVVGGTTGDRQANANGALQAVASRPIGIVLIALAALGFTAFGVVRLAASATDDRHGGLRRLSTAGQGLLYLGMAAITFRFVLGSRTTGSEQQQKETARTVLALPFGRLLLGIIGVIVLAMCTWQLIVAARGHFADTLHDEDMSGTTQRWTIWTARIGIPARALAVVPVGVFLVVAAIRADPQKAKGLDALLLDLTHSTWGRVLVVLTAAGFVVFGVYSLLEARYRQVSAGA